MGNPDSSCKGTIVRGKWAAHCKVHGLSVVTCAKTAKRDRDALWDAELGGAKKPCIRWL